MDCGKLLPQEEINEVIWGEIPESNFSLLTTRKAFHGENMSNILWERYIVFVTLSSLTSNIASNVKPTLREKLQDTTYFRYQSCQVY